MSEVEPIVFYSKVRKIEERFKRVYVKGFGPLTEFRDQSEGWYASLEGSYESIFVGDSKPNINVGDEASIRISFHAQPK